MKNIKLFFKDRRLMAIMLIALGFGLLGGLAGGILMRSYLLETSYNFSDGKYAQQGLIISNPKNVIVEQDVKTDETISAAGNSLVGIYKKQKQAKTASGFALENFYKIGSAVGQGFIITSDGWIATNLSLDKVFADYVVITRDKKIYPIDRAAKDSLTEFTFIHVSARDFPARKFAEKQSIKRGNLAIAVSWLGLSRVSTLAALSDAAGGQVKSSDNFLSKLILDDKLPAEFKGSVIFNLAGEVLGLVDNSGEIEPIYHLKAAAESLFKNKTANRPSLGVNYLCLSGLASADGQSAEWQKGAIIYKDNKNAAVKKNSPADKAGLLENDVIISVDNVNLDKDNDLAEVIQNYSAGDKINLVYSRNGQEAEVEITLEALK